MANTRQWLSAGVVMAVVFSGGECFQWTDSLQDSAFVAACVHGNLTLPWTFALSSGDTVEDIKWNFRSQHGQQELIATYISGMFLSTPSFSQRAQYLASSGLLLYDVTKGDTGNFSVAVVVRDSSNVVHDYSRTVLVEVADGLRVREEPGPVYDPETDSWHASLTCGTVVSPDGLPGDILWQTPSGVLPSTKYEDGYFYLQLQNPVKGGDYSCTLAPHSTASICLPPSSQQEPKINVDETTTRVSLLEAENGHLKVELAETRTELSQTRSRLEKEINQTQARLIQLNTDHTTRFNQLEARLTALQDTMSRQVSFYARMSSGQIHYNAHDRVVLSRLLTSHGGGYSTATGIFTVPITGTYFIAATAGFSTGSSAALTVMVSYSEMCFASANESDNYDLSSTCTMTVRLTAGQTVWLRSGFTAVFNADMTTFTGFLVHVG